jgi:FKBP-type peptidyl-prolyl cis-trans isomerase FklB
MYWFSFLSTSCFSRQSQPKRTGLKKLGLFYLFRLVAIVAIIVLGVEQGVRAQSRSDKAMPAEKGGQTIPDKPEDALVLKTQKDRVNYAIGVNLIGNLKKQGVDINLNLVMKGMQDAFSGDKLLMSDIELRKAVVQYQTEVRRMQTNVKTMTAEENRQAGEAFLDENRSKDGVVTLPSGVQYRIVKPGDGKRPLDTDTVECHYRGTLINGNEFDSSYRTGHPAIFKVNGVISGWREALKLMPVGSVWQIFIPSPLAYGERGTSGLIGPNDTLVFEVELLAIK